MPSTVITLVTDRCPVNVMKTLTLIEALDNKVVTNSLGDLAIIHIKVEDDFVIPSAEVFVLKILMMDTFDSNIKVKKESSASSPPARRLSIIGDNRTTIICSSVSQNLEGCAGIANELISISDSNSLGRKNARNNILGDFEDFTNSSSSSSSSSSSALGQKTKIAKK